MTFIKIKNAFARMAWKKLHLNRVWVFACSVSLCLRYSCKTLSHEQLMARERLILCCRMTVICILYFGSWKRVAFRSWWHNPSCFIFQRDKTWCLVGNCRLYWGKSRVKREVEKKSLLRYCFLNCDDCCLFLCSIGMCRCSEKEPSFILQRRTKKSSQSSCRYVCKTREKASLRP